MLADAMLDVERCRIDDKTAPQTKGSRLRAQFDTCFFSRSCRMTDLGNRGPTRATRVDIDRWTRVKACALNSAKKSFPARLDAWSLTASTIRQCTSPYQPSFSRGGSKRVTWTGCLPARRPSLSLSLVLNLRRAPPSSGTCLPARGPRAPPNAHKRYAPAPWRM